MSKGLKTLDERGFIFLDAASNPFLCCIWGDNPWLFYWHADKKWVTLRQVTQAEIWTFPRNLTEEQQDLYRPDWQKPRPK